MRERDLRILDYQLGDKALYIVKDHPVAIKCWKKALKRGLITAGALLVHIDRHADSWFNKENREKSNKLLQLSDQELDEFILHDLHPDNSEFIANAMIGGLISDCISIHWESGSHYGTFVEGEYSTTPKYQIPTNDSEHDSFIYETQDIKHLFGSHSLLGDTCTHQDTKRLFADSEYIILDVDLDFFTYTNNETYAKNKKDIRQQLSSSSFGRVLARARIITLALEPRCCGSNEDCLEILEIVNDVIFRPRNVDVLPDVKTMWLQSY